MFSNAVIGTKLEGTFLLIEKEEKETRTKKPYLILTLRDDGKNEEKVKLWNASNESFPYEKNSLIACVIQVREFQGGRDYVLETYREAIEGEATIENYIIAAPYSANDMYDYILRVAKCIRNQSYQNIIFDLFIKYKEKILYWSAAKSVHHNIRSGYLYHTFRMLQTAIALGKVYPSLNKDLLFTGVILHDIGKIKELSTDEVGNAEYNLEGSLLGHLFLGCEMINEFKNEDDNEDLLLLKHVIASHHGLREWGAIENPQLPEAILVHYIDKIDADMYQCEKALEKVTCGFTDKIFGLGTKLYKPF